MLSGSALRAATARLAAPSAPPSRAPTVQADPPARARDARPALARARAAYATGNQHLFAGQADAAIVSYNQALADYPSYVAGYRGLGLAYAQQGDRSAALTAFKTYVSLAPNARDVALIEKRISRLSIAAH